MGQYDWQTCPKVIKAEINTLQTEFEKIIGDNLTGIYLYGSLAQGGFNPARSDLNMLVLTEQELTLAAKRALIELLLRVSKAPCPVDIYFLTGKALFPFRKALPVDLYYNEKLRAHYQQDLHADTGEDWHEQGPSAAFLAMYLAAVQQCGVCISGKLIADAFPSIPDDDVCKALLNSFQGARGHHLQDPVSFVLNACRDDAYVQDKVCLSKDAGGVWGLAHLPTQYQALIQQSLALYRGERPGRPVGRSILDDFAAYMDEAIHC